jgi:AraC-like DNA-binding protein
MKRQSGLHPLVTWPFVEVARSLGLPPGLVERALQDAGTAGVARGVPGEARMPHAVANALLTAAAELSGRADLGLLAAQAVEPGHFDLIELASRSQRTVGEAVATIAALVPLLHDGLKLALETDGERSVLRVALREGLSLHPAGYDFIAATLLIAGRRQTGVPDVKLHALELPYPRPHDPGYLQRFFSGSALSFDAPALAVHVASASLALPLLRSDARAGKLLRAAAEELLPDAGRPQDELERRVRELVRQGLGSGQAELPAIARALHVSDRTLRRKLEQAGVHFRAVVDEERRARALQLVDEQALSTEALAAALGFSTAQALHRAFRRWTGTTIQAYRHAEKPR